MTLPQIRALLGLSLTTWWRACLTCALMCGLRPGELLGLRWEDAMGHINSTITKAVYRHQIRDEVTAAATAMDGIFGEASGS
jgi:hypothetical protein